MLVSQVTQTIEPNARRHAAKELGLGDSYTADPAEAARGADLVVICTPMGAYAEMAKAIAPALKPGAIVSDVGSAKRARMQDDLPGGGRRLVMPAEGIEYTVVNGRVSYEHGRQNGTLAGEVIRSSAA